MSRRILGRGAPMSGARRSVAVDPGGPNRGWKASGRLDQQTIQTHIRLIQKAAGAPVTGRYDLTTRDRVKRWQIDHGVAPSKGIVGQLTWTAMARAHGQ